MAEYSLLLLSETTGIPPRSMLQASSTLTYSVISIHCSWRHRRLSRLLSIVQVHVLIRWPTLLESREKNRCSHQKLSKRPKTIIQTPSLGTSEHPNPKMRPYSPTAREIARKSYRNSSGEANKCRESRPYFRFTTRRSYRSPRRGILIRRTK